MKNNNPPANGTTENINDSLTTHTVLITDDSLEDRYILKRYLKKTKLSLIILECENGAEGIATMTSPLAELQAKFPGISSPITLFLDINMPVMNGWELIEQVEKKQDIITLAPNIVIMYSSADANIDKRKAKNYSLIKNHLVKCDVTPDRLKQVIENKSR